MNFLSDSSGWKNLSHSGSHDPPLEASEVRNPQCWQEMYHVRLKLGMGLGRVYGCNPVDVPPMSANLPTIVEAPS